MQWRLNVEGPERLTLCLCMYLQIGPNRIHCQMLTSTLSIIISQCLSEHCVSTLTSTGKSLATTYPPSALDHRVKISNIIIARLAGKLVPSLGDDENLKRLALHKNMLTEYFVEMACPVLLVAGLEVIEVTLQGQVCAVGPTISVAVLEFLELLRLESRSQWV